MEWLRARASLRRLVIYAFGLAVALALPATANAAIFTVTSTGDSGAGTLRTVIQTANTTPGADEIDFGGAGEGTITPLTALPVISEQLSIDGGLAVTLDGSSLSSGAAGLRIDADDCQIAGHNIGNFPGNGIEVGSGVANTALEKNAIGSNGASGIALATGSSDASIVGNQIGADESGTIAQPNALDGIRVAGSSHQVGGASVGQGNLISGNTGPGVRASASGTTVTGNLIGLEMTGSSALPNGSSGVEVVGGTGAAANVISGNLADGVTLSAAGATVKGNLIGTDSAGSTAVGNTDSGVRW